MGFGLKLRESPIIIKRRTLKIVNILQWSVLDRGTKLSTGINAHGNFTQNIHDENCR